MAGEKSRKRWHDRLINPTAWRTGHMPAWILLPQLFLAIGWLRAGTANAITDGWWSGEKLRLFLEVDTSHAVTIYQPFLTQVVEPFAVVVAAMVCIAELVIAALLAQNRRVVGALLVAAFLNVHFMLAGVVNPSAFYLVIAMVIVLWRLEDGTSAAARRAAARRAGFAALVTTLGLAPFVTTIQPAQVIEDPAIVLIFLSVVFAIATWWAHEQGTTRRPTTLLPEPPKESSPTAPTDPRY